jgi:hypothetical protein
MKASNLIELPAHSNLIHRSTIAPQPVIAQQHASVNLVSLRLHYRKLKFCKRFSNVMISVFFTFLKHRKFEIVVT